MSKTERQSAFSRPLDASDVLEALEIYCENTHRIQYIQLIEVLKHLGLLSTHYEEDMDISTIYLVQKIWEQATIPQNNYTSFADCQSIVPIIINHYQQNQASYNKIHAQSAFRSVSLPEDQPVNSKTHPKNLVLKTRTNTTLTTLGSERASRLPSNRSITMQFIRSAATFSKTFRKNTQPSDRRIEFITKRVEKICSDFKNVREKSKKCQLSNCSIICNPICLFKNGFSQMRQDRSKVEDEAGVTVNLFRSID